MAIEHPPTKCVTFKSNPIHWQGSFIIKQKLSPAVYVVSRIGESKTQVVNVDRFAVYIERPEEWGVNDHQ